MPTFCRHNRFVQNCPICAREQAAELRQVVSPGTAKRPRSTSGRGGHTRSTGVQVRRLARGADDGFHSSLVPGLKSSEDAERLAEELAFAAGRLTRLESDPPGLYAEVAGAGDAGRTAGDLDLHGDLEERTWLAFLIAYLSPIDGDDPFAGIRAAWTPWSTGEEPDLADVPLGPRTAHDPARGTRTLDAYRAWAGRAGSQAAAFGGDPAWSAERRFARAFERLALPSLHRDARFDLLVTLGRVGVYDLRAGSLQFGGENEPTLAAKRALGIGDTLLLERRAAELAAAVELPLEALDLGLYNWGRGVRCTMGLEPGAEPEPDAVDSVRAALGL
ncbi:MAG TPA: hypothetical protein VG275_01755 [Solirubrobacteraceae bacterium]|nr:hypothetical protein [Solirubrobacteraceae bacterium]